MLVWGWVVLGRAFALNTLASSVLSPAFLALFEGMLEFYLPYLYIYYNNVYL